MAPTCQVPPQPDLVLDDLALHRHAVDAQHRFRYGDVADDAARRGHAEVVVQETLYEVRVAHVRGFLDVLWDRGDGEHVCRIKGAAEHEAGGMRERDHDGVFGAAVAHRNFGGEVGDDGKFVFDLNYFWC